jgi:hypothetical protein
MAWRAGLRRGQFVSYVGMQRVRSPQEFYDAVAGHLGAVELVARVGQDPATRHTVSP